MKTPTIHTYELIVLCIFSSIMGMIVGFVSTTYHMETTRILPMKKAAVDLGYAHWEVVDNSTGQTKFAWNETEKEVKEMFANLEKPLGSFSEDFTEK